MRDNILSNYELLGYALFRIEHIPCDPTWEHAGHFFDNRDFYDTHSPDNQMVYLFEYG